MVSIIVPKIGREGAFTIAMLSWVVCGAILLSMTWTVERDEAKVYVENYRQFSLTIHKVKTAVRDCAGRGIVL